MMIAIAEDSPLRKPPREFSRKQVLVLDGLRYAAEMCDIAYERLWQTLQGLPPNEPLVRDTASVMLDAWSIIDSVNRFRDFVSNLPGLANSTWKRLLQERTADVAALRDCVQHQLGEIPELVQSGGQLWGYLSWAEMTDDRYTGVWRMLAAGSDYVGDSFTFIGPMQLPFPIPPGRVRLNAFDQQVYLGRTVSAVAEAVANLTAEVASGSVRPIGLPATERRGADMVIEGSMEVLYGVPPRTTS